jgi:hypothetical protein
MPSVFLPELDAFLTDWKKDPNTVKPVFMALYARLAALPGVSLDYRGRPGVSHSLRARHEAQRDRELFVLVDIIDDEPEARWLSVCFYADLVMDPDERGDVVPGGLMGEDARCFDVDEGNEQVDAYLLDRVTEAAANAGR